MRIKESCCECLFDKQEHLAKKLDEEKRGEYLAEIQKILDGRRPQDSAPYMVYLFKQVQPRFFGKVQGYADIKKKYNDLVLSMENSIEEKILASKDPLETSMIYARLGNYIDFGAMNNVDEAVFLKMLEDAAKDDMNRSVYQQFLSEMEQAKQFLLLCDNCGEIVLDKLFVRQLRKRFPKLEITALVRGEETLNDATIEDALYCGLDKEMKVLSNGNGVAGTVESMLGAEAAEAVRLADVILSKGQGNYETMMGSGRNVYYSFLCKCDLFTKRFQVPKYTGMFVKEVAGQAWLDEE